MKKVVKENSIVNGSLKVANHINKKKYKNGKQHVNGFITKSSDLLHINGDKKLPKLSVIIPVYQEEKLLESTLQLFTNELKEVLDYELIVSDGGSTDATVDIALKYADNVVVHEQARRQTIAEGRNRGAEIATGEILIFINGDTVPSDFSNFFNSILKWYWGTDYKKYDALACAVAAFPNEEKLRDRIFYFIHNKYIRFLNMIGLGMGRGECQVVKKVVFDNVNGYNSSLAAGEDFDLYRRIAKIGKIKYDKNIHVYESPRRFRKYGYIKTIIFWMLNALSVMFVGRSVSKDWEAIR